jgi:hypothetical protein
MSRLYNEESRFTKKAKEEYLSLQKEHTQLKGSHHNAEADDLFDRVSTFIPTQSAPPTTTTKKSASRCRRSRGWRT